MNTDKDIQDIESIAKYIQEIESIAKKYLKEKQDSSKIGFNAFKLASDLYYRENFHSDILCEILNPQGSHDEGNLFLELFIECINKTISQGEKIDIDNYQNAKVVREVSIEENRIDILIKSEQSEQSKHCIIIENKLNNAEDMDWQLPRYYHAMKDNNYTVDRIIYMPLDRNKAPDQLTWKEGDKEAIASLLTIMPASDEEKLDLKSWLLECKEKAWYLRSRSVIDQYIELIKFLAEDDMSDTIKKFYETLLETGKKECVEAIIKMSNEELPYFMAMKLKKEFGYSPSTTRKEESTNFAVYIISHEKSNLTVNIWCYGLNGYKVILCDKVENTFKNEEILNDLNEICKKTNGENTKDRKWIFEKDRKWITRTFGFDQEKDVIDQVKEVIKYLNTIKD